MLATSRLITTAAVGFLLLGPVVIAAQSDEGMTAPLEWSHVGLGIGTLVPVTEGSVWSSNCQPATRQAVLEVWRLAQALQPAAKPDYDYLRVRAAVLLRSSTLFVSEGRGLKLVTPTSVIYMNAAPNSSVALAIDRAFKQCSR